MLGTLQNWPPGKLLRLCQPGRWLIKRLPLGPPSPRKCQCREDPGSRNWFPEVAGTLIVHRSADWTPDHFWGDDNTAFHLCMRGQKPPPKQQEGPSTASPPWDVQWKHLIGRTDFACRTLPLRERKNVVCFKSFPKSALKSGRNACWVSADCIQLKESINAADGWLFV